MANINRKKNRRRVHFRIRKKVEGTEVRPRLAVHFSNKNIYAQLIDDVSGKTLASASTKDKKAGIGSSSNWVQLLRNVASLQVSIVWFSIEEDLYIVKK